MKQQGPDDIVLDKHGQPEGTGAPLVNHPHSLSWSEVKKALSRYIKAAVRHGFAAVGFDLLNRRAGSSLTTIRKELEDFRAFRFAAEEEIVKLKDQTLADRDQLAVQKDYLSALQSVVAEQDKLLLPEFVSAGESTRSDRISMVNIIPNDGTSEEDYPSCSWIEGGLSFVPGRVRVCPNSHSQGGTPGLLSFKDGRLPVDDILAQRDIIRRANRIDCFDPCNGCAYRVKTNWKPRRYAFDLLCISHATACNLACNYCHTIPEDRYLQNPNSVPRLYPTIEALISDGHLAPDSRVQWGGGEPTILKEFPELFTLLDNHGANSEVFSSGVRVSEVLMDGLARNCAGVMISLDAGTRETYARIKGRPVFDRVVTNVGRYARVNPGRTILKMILFEENLGEILQFLDIAERKGVRIVCFDTPMYRNRVDNQIIDAASLFSDEAAKRGLECRIGEVGSVYNPSDQIADRVAHRRGVTQ
jgi:molybdenum cofactor biosynthesis enzyme MoaA